MTDNRVRIWTIDRPDRSGNVGLTHFLMKHLVRSGNQKKKTHFVGLFFLTGLRPVLHLWCSTPSARCAFGAPPPNLIVLAPRSVSHARLDRRCAYPRTALRTLPKKKRPDNMGDRLFLFGERWVNPLPDEASRAKWEPEKKDPLHGSFFSYRPSAGAAPRSVAAQWKNCQKGRLSEH